MPPIIPGGGIRGPPCTGISAVKALAVAIGSEMYGPATIASGASGLLLRKPNHPVERVSTCGALAAITEAYPGGRSPTGAALV